MRVFIGRLIGYPAIVMATFTVVDGSTATAEEVSTIRAVRAAPSPLVDGKLTEPCWQGAQVARDFKLLRTHKRPTQPTEVRVVWDDTTLYVGFVCHDDRMDAVAAAVKTRDGAVYEDDCVELFLAPRDDPSVYYHLLVNAANTQRDDIGSDAKWDARWTSAVARDSDGWSVEMAIPLRELPLDAASFGTWRVNFARSRQSTGEQSSWSPCSSGFHEPKRFGRLTGIEADLAGLVSRRLSRELTELARRTGTCVQQIPSTLDTPLARSIREDLKRLVARLRDLGVQTREARTPVLLKELQADIAVAERRLTSLRRRMTRIRLADAVRSKRGPETAWAVCQVSTMTKLPAAESFDGMPAPAVTLSLAGNETEAAQFVIVPLDASLEGLRVSVGRLEQRAGKGVILPGQIALRRVGYVRTTRPSAGAAYAPGLLPDPLLPNAPVDVPADGIQPFWLTVHALPDAPPGEYAGELRISAKGHKTQMTPVAVRVYGFNLPHRPALRTAFLLNKAYLSQRHGVSLADDAVPGWIAGVWSGDDVQGRKNYFGVGEFEHALDRSVKHHGRQSARITGKKVVRGTHEGPRASYHTGPIALKKGRTYEFTVWYKTDGLTGLADAWLSGGLGGVTLQPSTTWKQVKKACTPNKDVQIYLYLRNHAVGTIWFDDARLVDTTARKDLLPSPGFEPEPGKSGTELLGEYRSSMLAHRICDADVAQPTITVVDDPAAKDGVKVEIDWTEFDREIQSYLIGGLNAFNVRWLRIGGGWGDVTTPTAKRDRAVSAQIISQTEKHLIEKGWIDLAYIYVFDEPGAAAREKIVNAFNFVHKHGPRLRPLLTYGYGATKPWTWTRPDGPEAGYAAYLDAVDVHVPHIDCCDWRVLDRLRERKQKELWHYVCISARKPYPNIWAIDCTGVDNRIVYWQLWRYRLTGTLYWCVNYWKVDVWQDPMSYPGGNGDGSLYYPGKTGPVESVRLELTRDGIDDYDYLALLARLVKDSPKGVPADLIARANRLCDVTDLCPSFIEHTSDARAIEKRRDDLARAIEQLRHAGRTGK